MALLIFGLDQHIAAGKAWRDEFRAQLPALDDPRLA